MTNIQRRALRGLRAFLTVVLGVMLTAPMLAQQAPAGQSEFVPVSQLPATEQLPGGVFVVVAYAFIWVATVGYLWFIWRRLGRVEAEMRALERRRPQGSARG
jgi:CcmD family protein